MATKVSILAVALVACTHFWLNEAFTLSSAAEAEVFRRERMRHTASLVNITKHMTVARAMRVLQAHGAAGAEIASFVHAATNRSYQASRTNLRAQSEPEAEKTYGEDVVRAKDKLNDMIYETQMQYEIEHKKCCDYEVTKKSLIEDAASDIALFNAESAKARAEILDAQGQINIFETKLPKLKESLSEHNKKCDESEKALSTELENVSNDRAIMESLSEAAACKPPADGHDEHGDDVSHDGVDDAEVDFDRTKTMMLLQCEHPCTQDTHMLFANHKVRNMMGKLRSNTVRELLQTSLTEAHVTSKHQKHVDALLQEQVDEELVEEYNAHHAHRGHRRAGQRLRAPGSSPGPCTKPAPTDPRSVKCAMGPGNCKIIQERLLVIHSQIIDKQRDLKEEIQELQKTCKEVKTSLENQIDDFTTQLGSQQTKLAESTKAQNTADEQNRLKTVEKTDLEKEFAEMTETCHKNYQSFEDQECGLKKIRGELLRMKAPELVGTSTDCQLSEWGAKECSKSCAGGQQTLTRTIITMPKGGVKCLPLERVQPCNTQNCPIDCKVGDWESWSGCTAECGGGIMQRGRPRDVKPKYGGKTCGETSEVRSCNQHSCNADCVLTEWTPWSLCSKGCGGGRERRLRFISEPARGTGKCPKEESEDREQFKACNTKACLPNLRCETALDVILLVDGSSRLGEDGWKAMKSSAEKLVTALGASGKVKVSLIAFSGPETLAGLSKCTNEDPTAPPPDLEKDCKIKVVAQLTADTKKVVTDIRGLAWPEGPALTSVALTVAEAELALGRKDANSVVVVLTRGKPLSNDMTTLTSKRLKKKARVMWVPVTGFENLDLFSKWSSEPDEENIVAMKDFAQMQEQKSIDSIVAAMCPQISVEAPVTCTFTGKSRIEEVTYDGKSLLPSVTSTPSGMLADWKVAKSVSFNKVPGATLAVTAFHEEFEPFQLRPGMVVTIRGGREGKLCSDEVDKIRCIRDALGEWEKFEVIDAGNGKLALRGGHNKKLCADEGNTIKCDRGNIGDWEKFTIVKNGDGWNIKGGRDGKFCCDEQNGVICNRGVADGWERFRIECIGNCGVPASFGGSCNNAGFAITCDEPSLNEIGNWKVRSSGNAKDSEASFGRGPEEGWGATCPSTANFYLPGKERYIKMWANGQNKYASFRIRV